MRYVPTLPPINSERALRAYLDREFQAITRAFGGLGADRARGATLFDFGAVGDGETDDAGAVQAAVDSGETIIVPKATFLVGSRVTISRPCSLVGLGWESVLIGPDDGTHIILLVQDADFEAIDGIRLEHFVVDGNGGGQLDAGLVQVNNARSFLVNHLWVKNGSRVSGVSGVNGISCSAGSVAGHGPSGVIANCRLENTSKGAINWTTGGDGAAIISNIIRDIGGNGSAPAIQVNGGRGAKIIGNDTQDCEGAGIYVAAVGTVPPIDAEETIIAANRVKNCGASSTTNPHGIQVANATAAVEGRLVVASNTVTGSGNAAGGGNGILLQNTKNAVCANNVVRESYYDGIRVETSDYVAVSGNRCTANNVGAVGAGGIRVKGTCAHVSVIGNNCADDGATQDYGLVLESGAVLSYLTVDANDFSGNVLGELLANEIGSKARIRVVSEKQTTDAAATTIQYFSMPDPSAYRLRASVVGVQSGGAHAALYSREGLFRRNGGAAAQEGATTTLGTDIKSDATWGDASLAVGANACSVRATGKAATTIDWRVESEVIGL